MDADRLNKLREERLAREKARIEKLRQLNLKKYSTSEDKAHNFNLSTSKPVKSETNIKPNHVKNNFHVNGTTKKPITMPVSHKTVSKDTKNLLKLPKTNTSIANTQKDAKNNVTVGNPECKLPAIPKNSSLVTNNTAKTNDTITNKSAEKVANGNTTKTIPKVVLNKSASLRQSMVLTEKQNTVRKSMFAGSQTVPTANKPTEPANKSTTNVFERLYKPKSTSKQLKTDVEKLQTDPNYLKKVIRSSGLILNKRHTVFDSKPKIAMPVRRSISAVHFKRISKQELGNCIHKWSSIGDKLNNVHLKHINEDESVEQDKVVSAVKSERKKVTFLTPMSNFNTPKPEELQARLKTWLQKRGKSMDSYQHLQCFSIHHLPQRLRMVVKYDDENKENIALESDSDDDSYTENMNVPTDKWRSASIVSDSVDLNETQNTTLTCSDVVNMDEVLIGALNDLTELLKEGFDWEQCARWLRAIRDRFPSAPHTAAYWECRASLEERRGDLPASVQCWEEAIAKGTEHSIVEANLDQLLDKFMQLKISPTSGKRQPADAKLVDVKNVFKSTIIRFAVQQAKLRQSNQMDTPKYLVTPVRRSGRLSIHHSAKRVRTPLQVCESLRQADEITAGNTLFVPNRNLHGTP